MMSTNDDIGNKILPDDDFARVYARIYSMVIANSVITEDGMAVDYGSLKKKAQWTEDTFNLIVQDVGQSAAYKFLMAMALKRFMANETEFFSYFGSAINKLAKIYDKRDLGYAIAILRSGAVLSEDKMYDLIQKNTVLSEDDIPAIRKGLMEW